VYFFSNICISSDNYHGAERDPNSHAMQLLKQQSK